MRGRRRSAQRSERSRLTGNHAPMNTMPGDALGVLGREQQPPLRAGGERHAHRAVDAARIHHVDRVLGELALVVRARLLRAVGPAVAARVEADDAEVPGEVRDLRLPDARVHERPRRQEQQGLLALAVGLPEDANAVALDEALLVRVAGAALLARRVVRGAAVGDRSSGVLLFSRGARASARSSPAALRGPRRSPPGAPPRSPARTSSSWRRAPRPGTVLVEPVLLGRLRERLRSTAPLLVDEGDARAQVGVAPGQRLQLHPDLRIAGLEVVLLEAPRGAPLLDERHDPPRTSRAAARSGAT